MAKSVHEHFYCSVPMGALFLQAKRKQDELLLCFFTLLHLQLKSPERSLQGIEVTGLKLSLICKSGYCKHPSTGSQQYQAAASTCDCFLSSSLRSQHQRQNIIQQEQWLKICPCYGRYPELMLSIPYSYLKREGTENPELFHIYPLNTGCTSTAYISVFEYLLAHEKESK